MATGGLDIQIRGFKEAYRLLDKFDHRAIKKRFHGAFQRSGNDLRGNIRSEAPRRTGRLARSVRVRTLRGGGVGIGPTVPYGRYVIRGTRRGVQPNPFVDRAVAPRLGATKRLVRDEVLRKR